MIHLLLKWLHIISSTVLFGTGAGIAFFMWRTHRSQDVRVIAAVAADVVRADFLFTATAVVVQPLTGFLLVRELGLPVTLPWIHAAIWLYVLVGCCWLPVVWLQIRMRDIARRAVAEGVALPPEYHRYFKLWFLLGWPAFAGVLAIFWIMIARPF
ncbi:MAG: DUF2269 domain-containing protein [Pseudomonadota bacterium]